MLPRFSPTGTYLGRHHDRTRGFRLLAHAEVEAYLETACDAFATRMVVAWRRDGVARRSISALVATYEESRSRQGRLRNVDGITQLTAGGLAVGRQTVSKGLRTYRRRVLERNNGVKEAHVVQMTARVGILRSELDPVWLAVMDSFGSSRNTTAHSSRQTQVPPDPRTESRAVVDVVRGLAELDRILESDR